MSETFKQTKGRCRNCIYCRGVVADGAVYDGCFYKQYDGTSVREIRRCPRLMDKYKKKN